MDSKLNFRTYLLVLIVAGFFLYFPSLFGNFLLDDEDFLYANSYVKNFRISKFFNENAIAGRGKLSNYYRPIQLTIYAFIYKIFGLSPFVFHFFNVAFHISASVLAFYFLLKISKNKTIAFLTSVIFLIHPVQTEAVSYVSGLPDLLYSLFLFTTIIFYLKFRKNLQPGFFLLSLGFFILSLLSKELGLLTVPLIFLIEFFFPKKGFKKRIPLITMLFIIGLGYLAARLTFLQFQNIKELWLSFNKDYATSTTTRILTFLNLIPTYLLLLLFPLTLHIERDYSVSIIKTPNLTIWLVIIFNLAIVGMLALLAKKNNKFSLSLFFYLAFLISLAPFSGILLLNGIFYEHYLYLSILFFFGFVFSFLGRFFNKPWWQMVFLLFLIFLVVRSLLRQYDWIDEERFYKNTLKYAPKSTRILNNLAITLSDKGKTDEAVYFYKKAIKITPTNPVLYHNLANAWAGKGDLKKAEKYYLKAIELNPHFSFSYVNLLKLYQFTKQENKAKALFKKWNQMNKRLDNR